MTTTAEAKEHPIIFNGWSIRGILSGRKTQTRRIMKPQPPETMPEDSYLDAYAGGPEWCAWTYQDKVHSGEEYGDEGSCMWTCPYGKPGDVLYVREVFRFEKAFDEYAPADLVRSEKHPTLGREDVQYEATPGEGPLTEETAGRKRPSIHMPRELCRLRLRVEDVRVERVQSISREDAVSEGVREVKGVDVPGMASAYEDVLSSGDSFCFGAQTAFMRLWNSIHGEGAWERNDWVWVIEFSRINDTSR